MTKELLFKHLEMTPILLHEHWEMTKEILFKHSEMTNELLPKYWEMTQKWLHEYTKYKHLVGYIYVLKSRSHQKWLKNYCVNTEKWLRNDYRIYTK